MQWNYFAYFLNVISYYHWLPILFFFTSTMPWVWGISMITPSLCGFSHIREMTKIKKHFFARDQGGPRGKRWREMHCNVFLHSWCFIGFAMNIFCWYVINIFIWVLTLVVGRFYFGVPQKCHIFWLRTGNILQTHDLFRKSLNIWFCPLGFRAFCHVTDI